MKIKIPTKDLEKYLSSQYQGKNMKLKAYYEYCATCEHPDAKHLQFVLPEFFEIEVKDLFYEKVLKRIETLMNNDPEPDSQEGKELMILSDLMKSYEDKVFPKDLGEEIIKRFPNLGEMK